MEIYHHGYHLDKDGQKDNSKGGPNKKGGSRNNSHAGKKTSVKNYNNTCIEQKISGQINKYIRQSQIYIRT